MILSTRKQFDYCPAIQILKHLPINRNLFDNTGSNMGRKSAVSSVTKLKTATKNSGETQAFLIILKFLSKKEFDNS